MKRLWNWLRCYRQQRWMDKNWDKIPKGIISSRKVLARLAKVDVSNPEDSREPEKQIRKVTKESWTQTIRSVSTLKGELRPEALHSERLKEAHRQESHVNSTLDGETSTE